MTDIENIIKELIKKHQIHANYNNYTEIFEINNNISLEEIIKEINKIVNINNNLLIEDIKFNTLESDNNYHKQNKLLELKNKIFDFIY